MLDFKIRELLPLCPPLQPEIDLLPEYMERIRLILVKCDIIEMITSGIKPGMTKAEYRKMKEDLSVINELRHIAGGQPLFPDKNLDGHFEGKHTAESDKEDKDDKIFGNSDSDSNSINETIIKETPQYCLQRWQDVINALPSENDVSNNSNIVPMQWTML